MRENNVKKMRKQHILIYAHYYELASTGQLLRELAEGLLPQFRVTVIAAVPSYLGTVEDRYKKHRYYFENHKGVDVIRVRVPEFQKGKKISRIKNILVYFLRAVRATGKVKNVDFVMAISQPPILGGMLGVYGKWRHSVEKRRSVKGSVNSHYGNSIYLNKSFAPKSEDGMTAEASVEGKANIPKYIYWMQDSNPEQIKVVGYFRVGPLLWLLEKLDTYSCSKADLVIVPARDMVETVRTRFVKHPERMPEIKVINNWIDEKKIYPFPANHPGVVEFKKKYGLENKYIIMYSGNLGNYYSLPELLKVIERFPAGTRTQSCTDMQADMGTQAATNTQTSISYPDGQEVVFAFIGGGAQKDNMEAYVEESHMSNVFFIPYQDKEDLIYSLNAAAVHWCVNAKGIKGVSCPSKYYGIAAVGKPVLGVLEKGTEIRRVLEECGGGLVCEPGDYEGIGRNIRWFIENAGSMEMLAMGKQNRRFLEERLGKDRSIGKFMAELARLGNMGGS